MIGPATPGRVAVVALLAVAGLLVGLGWVRAHRDAGPIPVVRCPIHGIAYDAELEICPECAKASPARG